MTKSLIVNADDYGLTPGVSRGIRDAHQKGIVTSTTVMVGYASAESDVRTALAETPNLGLGLHFSITGNMPLLTASPSLHGLDGKPYPVAAFLTQYHKVYASELRMELGAQLERFRAITGRDPDHLDSHHHTLYLFPDGFRALLDIAAALRVPIRNPGFEAGADSMLRKLQPGLPEAWYAEIAPQIDELIQTALPASGVRCPDHFAGDFYERVTLGDLLLVLAQTGDGTTELMCHPGYVEPDLNSSYGVAREAEMTALTHRSAKELLASESIRLVTFGQVS